MRIFNLPDLGEGLPDAEIVEWHVKEGDSVTEDQPMVSMETAKAVVDVPCPYTGVIAKLHGQPGDVIDTGAVLVSFEDENFDSANNEIQVESNQQETIEPAEFIRSLESKKLTDTPEKLQEDIEDLIDELEETLPNTEEKVDTGNEDSGTVVGEMETSNKVINDMKMVGNFKIAPAVKALAKKLKVDLSTVTPTGPNGIIRPSDIKLAKHKQSQEPQTESNENQILEEPKSPETLVNTESNHIEEPVIETHNEPKQVVATETNDSTSSNDNATSDDWQQVKGPRRAMARIMAESHAQIVPTTIMDDADIQNWSAGEDITARLIRSIVKGIEKEPALNSWFNGEKLARRIINHVDIGIAVDTADGLFVPTMRNCEQKTAGDVRVRMNEIKEQVKSRSIPAADMKDFTFMLSNFGVFAGRYATPVITPPCVAIIASGKLQNEVVPVLGGFEVHKIIPLSLTFDHRAVTGGEAARFLAAVIKDLNKAK